MMKKRQFIYMFLITLLYSLGVMGQTQVAEWEQLVGVQIDTRNGALVKTEPDGWGNSGAYSKQELPASTDGYVQFNLQDPNAYFALGLSSTNVDNHFASINHAFFFERGDFYIVDAGKVVGQFGNYRVGDSFKIGRYNNANTIFYFYNDVKIYESTIDPTLVLHADVALFSYQILLNDVILSDPWVTPGGGGNLPPPDCSESDNLNWVESTTYDLEGGVLTESKTFSDRTGRLVQEQVKYQSTGEVFASQPIYDAFGRPVLETLSAPINKNYFCIESNFVTNENGDVYDYTDFDLENTSVSSQTGQINNPKRVNDDNQGTLGWYYSHNNTDEPYVANSDYPYSRVEYSKSNPGQVRRSSAAGNELRMGEGHEAESYIMPASSELYYIYGYAMDWDLEYYDGGVLSPEPINVDYQVIKTISLDQDKKEYVSFTDHDGKILATCRSGLATTPIQTVESIIPKQGYIDIHIPEHCEGSYMVHYPSSGYTNLKVKVLDLSTDKYVLNGTSEEYSIGQQPVLNHGYYRFEHSSGDFPADGVTISYGLNYEHFALNYYDKAKRLVRVIPPLGIDDEYSPELDVISLNSHKTPIQVGNNSSFITIDEPSSLNGISNGRIVQLSFNAYEVATDGASPIDDIDVIFSNIANNSYAMASRLENLTTDRINVLRAKPLTSGGINGKLTVPMPMAHQALVAQTINSYYEANEIYNQSYVTLNNQPISLSSTAAQIPAAPNGNGGNGGNGSLVNPYVNYRVKYNLGYKDQSNVFHSVTDGMNLTMNIRKDYIHLPTGAGQEGVNIELVDGLHHGIITENFADIDKYAVEITHVFESGIYYTQNANNTWTHVQYSNSIPSLVSQVTDLIKFKLSVEDYSQVAAPNHTTAKTYEYNSLNWLLKTNSPDEGISKFVYRNDGQIRFSQNARQQSEGGQYFSYTNYDEFGRAIESGQHKGSVLFSDHYADGTVGNQMEAIREYTRGFSPSDPTCTLCTDKSFIYYDIPRIDVPIIPGHDNRQTFVAGHITKTSNKDVATWYSYDHYGRVTWMIRRYDLGKPSQTDKLWVYTYDSKGNIGEVVYQPYTASEYFKHSYTYDADNRLEEVHTSRDITGASGNKIKQAHYIYYDHGALKRVELRSNLQGVDYVYTINGALKSINNPDMDYDPGNDGPSNSFNPDMFAMTLDYYVGDYSRSGSKISSIAAPSTTPPGSSIVTESNYSGSIRGQHWNNRSSLTYNEGNQEAYLYQYDAYSQLVDAQFASFRPDQLSSPGELTGSENFRVSNITYDKNGNLLTLIRKNSSGVTVDDLDYNYKDHPVTGDPINQLDHVDDVDADHMTSGDLEYDPSGRLKKNKADDLEYFYNTEGLVINIKKATTGQDIIKFYYDDAGFRYKKEHFSLVTNNINKTTLYVRDIKGRVTAIYNESNDEYTQEELAFYGNSRLGTIALNTTGFTDDDYFYELKDHLGNVRQVIRVNEGGGYDWASSKTDYYPFGMKFMNENTYRYGYQGEYAEDETEEEGIKANSFQLRLYNPRLGRWMNPDPYRQYYSPYLAMGNSPVNSIDPDGGYSWLVAWIKNGFSLKGLRNPTIGTGNYDSNAWGFNEGYFDGETYSVTFDVGSRHWGQKANTHNYFSINGNSFLVPKDNGSIGPKKYNFWANLTRTPDVNARLGGQILYSTANSFYTTGQFLTGKAVDRGMVNLDGTFTTTDDAVLGLADVGLNVIGIGAVDDIAKSSTTVYRIQRSGKHLSVDDLGNVVYNPNGGWGETVYMFIGDEAGALRYAAKKPGSTITTFEINSRYAETILRIKHPQDAGLKSISASDAHVLGGYYRIGVHENKINGFLSWQVPGSGSVITP